MSVSAYILLKVNSGMEKEVCKKVAELPEVNVASIIYGEYDIVARVSVVSLHVLEDFLADKIAKIAGVVLTSTMIVAQEFKGKSERNSK